MKSWGALNTLSNLGVKIIIVLGHKLCGPCKRVLTGGLVMGWKFSSRYFSTVTNTKDLEGDSVDNAVNENIQLNV